jgi:hypothetical protein
MQRALFALGKKYAGIRIHPIPTTKWRHISSAKDSLFLTRNKKDLLPFEVNPKDEFVPAYVAYCTLVSAILEFDIEAATRVMGRYPDFAFMSPQQFDEWAATKWAAEKRAPLADLFKGTILHPKDDH